MLEAIRAGPGGGGGWTPPSNSAPDARRTKRKENVRKLVKYHFETTSVIFFAQVKIEVTRGHESQKKINISRIRDMSSDKRDYLGN